ncbi:prephenate dehydrogenase [Paraburkholderia terricola]|nr:prephenate dehydrogenase [Paraburkholderia terricola]
MACISSVSTVSFWDGSKVSATKKHNKTAGAYSGIPAHDMREALFKAGFAARGASRRVRCPFAQALRSGLPGAPESSGYM